MGVDLRRTGDVTPLLNLPLSLARVRDRAACVVECLVLAATALPGAAGGGRA